MVGRTRRWAALSPVPAVSSPTAPVGPPRVAPGGHTRPAFEENTTHRGHQDQAHAPGQDARAVLPHRRRRLPHQARGSLDREDRKSTRLNSSHANISYAVFCLKKKKLT